MSKKHNRVRCNHRLKPAPLDVRPIRLSLKYAGRGAPILQGNTDFDWEAGTQELMRELDELWIRLADE